MHRPLREWVVVVRVKSMEAVEEVVVRVDGQPMAVVEEGELGAFRICSTNDLRIRILEQSLCVGRILELPVVHFDR